MIHRLGMHYLAHQLQQSQDAKSALQGGRKHAARQTAADREELRMLARTGAVVASAIGAVALILWVAN